MSHVAGRVWGTWILGGALVLLGGCASTAEESTSLLFVQSAGGLTCSGETIVLEGVHPATLYFSDRPERIVGRESTRAFVDGWSEGPDSFGSDPPNATLSILDEDELRVVVLALDQPRLSGDRLSYEVRVLDGTLPAEGAACTLFIDSAPHLVDYRDDHRRINDIRSDQVDNNAVNDIQQDQVRDIHQDQVDNNTTDDVIHDQVNDTIHDQEDHD